MKKITLLVAGLLFMGIAANASATIFSDGNKYPIAIIEAEPIVFEERGIEFFVFPDGQFDFNTRPFSTSADYYYRKGAKAVNKTYGTRNHVEANYGVKIEHDEFGRVRRVGNVFINYDANDRIKRIGSVYMNYNRYALVQVGGMKIIYDKKGEIVDFVGLVKGRSYDSGYTNNYYDGSYYGPAHGNDNDYYYYRTDGTKARVQDKDRTPGRTTGKR